MRPTYESKSPEQPVSRLLNEELIAKVGEVTSDLSEVVESVLATFVAKESMRQETRVAAATDAANDWNAFGEKHSSFADEHSTL